MVEHRNDMHGLPVFEDFKNYFVGKGLAQHPAVFQVDFRMVPRRFFCTLDAPVDYITQPYRQFRVDPLVPIDSLRDIIAHLRMDDEVGHAVFWRTASLRSSNPIAATVPSLSS